MSEGTSVVAFVSAGGVELRISSITNFERSERTKGMKRTLVHPCTVFGFVEEDFGDELVVAFRVNGVTHRFRQPQLLQIGPLRGEHVFDQRADLIAGIHSIGQRIALVVEFVDGATGGALECATRLARFLQHSRRLFRVVGIRGHCLCHLVDLQKRNDGIYSKSRPHC